MSGVRLNIKSNCFTLNNKTMFFYLLFFYLLSESMATGSTNDSTSYDVSNKIMCQYQGKRNKDGSYTVVGKSIPCECDAILYESLSINIFNEPIILDIDENLLKSVTDLKKPVIVAITRADGYGDWNAILGTNNTIATETKILCDFAKAHNIQGYELWNMIPSNIAYVSKNVPKNIISYIKQLKELCPFLIIGVAIPADLGTLKNKDIYNLKELNKVLTYYDLNALELNGCNPELYNGMTPISNSNTSDIHLYTLEELVSDLKKTEICFNKISITIPLLINDITNNNYLTYSDMCEGNFDDLSMCVQTSQNYFEKGEFCSKQKFGITVKGVEWDDSSNACNCTSTFNGFNNIYAGYKNCKVILCMKFDVQSKVYPYK